MKSLFVMALLSALALPAAATAGEGPASGSGPTAVALGKMVYDENCAACHGANLEGQPNWRQRNADGRLPAPPHDARGHTWHHDDATLFGITKLGTVKFTGLDIESDMPGFEEILSDAEIRAVIKYIKSRWPLKVRRQQNSINRRAPKR